MWSPSEIVCNEVLRDESFFHNCLPIVDSFIDNVLLPEIVAQHFTRETTKPLSEVSTSMTNNLHCICKRPDDGRRMMIYCENENCQNGQWFHFTCIKMTKNRLIANSSILYCIINLVNSSSVIMYM